MSKKLLWTVLAVAAITVVSCSREDGLSDNPDETQIAQTVEALPPVYLNALGGTAEVLLPEGDYILEVAGEDAGWLSVGEITRADDGKATINAKANETGHRRTAALLLKDPVTEAAVYTLTVSQSVSSIAEGSILIEEIFYTSMPLESTGKPETRHGDQYFKITNVSSDSIDISGLMIMEAKINSLLNHTYLNDVRPTHAPVQTVYCIPQGTMLYENASKIIANNAQDHTLTNPNSFDLSGADFEWFDQSSGSFTDIDNPSVPNLDIWFTYSASIWVLHDRGYLGYAIAMPPDTLTKAAFLADYKWEGQYINHTASGDYTMDISKAYMVPNDWVIDAVNLSVPGSMVTLPFHTSLDAGWTYCGNGESDPDRYGKSVRRKSDATGKLIDTNNSTNDFIPNATPSKLAP